MKMKRYKIPKVIGNTILVEVDPPNDQQLKSDFVFIPESAANSHNQRVLNSTDIGCVVSIGPDAFVKIHASEPYCIPGDIIMFIQNSGKLFRQEETDKYYRIIKEGDVLCVAGEKEDE